MSDRNDHPAPDADSVQSQMRTAVDRIRKSVIKPINLEEGEPEKPRADPEADEAGEVDVAI